MLVRWRQAALDRLAHAWTPSDHELRSLVLDAPRPRVLSVDVFDTLLRRQIPPHRVAEVAAHRLAARLVESGVACSSDEILQHRTSFAHTRHGHVMPAQREWGVVAWAATLAHDRGWDAESVAAFAGDAEVESEREATTLDPGIAALAAEARARGVKVIAVSDTTLDPPLMERLLAAHGVRVDEVFCSCAWGVAKRDGGLFGVVARELGADPREVVHIGDQLKGDFVRPRAAGWRARVRGAGRAIAAGRDDGVFVLSVSPTSSTDPLVRFGYECLAPLLVAFALAARARWNAARCDHVAWLARDGVLLLEADAALDEVHVAPWGRSYLRLSRRAVALSHPSDPLGQCTGIAGKAGRRTVGEWLGGYAIEASFRERLLTAAGLGEDAPFSVPVRRALGKAIDAHAAELEVLRVAEREAIALWVRSTCGSAVRRLGLADAGWAGTIQDSVAAALPSVEVVQGVYVGVSRGGLASVSRSEKVGVVWDLPGGRPPGSVVERSAGVIRAWELFLGEPAAGVRRLQRGAGGAVSVERSGSVPGHTHQAFVARVHEGARAGMAALLPAVRAWHDGERACGRAGLESGDARAWMRTARTLAGPVVLWPPSSVARAVLALEFDEGASEGLRSTLDVRSMRGGTVWWPGVVRAGLRRGEG